MKFRSAAEWDGNISRPPRGGRGLKFDFFYNMVLCKVAPLAGGVDWRVAFIMSDANVAPLAGGVD